MIEKEWNGSFGPLAGRDALGRRLPMQEKVGPRRQDRYVGMFYFLCNGQHGKTGPYNITEILKKDPMAAFKPDSPPWGPLWNQKDDPHHWGESLFGYYFGEDEWVLRRHIEMLTIAEIDFLVFDTTNRHTYFKVASLLMKLLDEYRQMGWKVPRIVYYTNTQSGETIQEIYEQVYKSGLYPENWFYWEGKPLIIGIPEECSDETRNYFTFRRSQWPNEPKKQDGFPWIEFQRPQEIYWDKQGRKELINVSIAQHPQERFGDSLMYGETRNWGRSFHEGQNDLTPDAVNWGYNFSEQWEYALEQDPRIVFVTGWNEWIAGRFKGPESRPVMFIDTVSQEFSRDIEPMKGGHFDNYYMQLVDYVRRFKGTGPTPAPGPAKSIDIYESFTQWETVTPEYRDFTKGNLHRNHPGHGTVYVNETGRNDFDVMKVARDKTHVYFYVKTAGDITPPSPGAWMWLLLNVNGYETDNWQGYNYIVNRNIADESRTSLHQSRGGWRWKALDTIRYRREGKEMQLAVPKKLLGIPEGDTPFEIQFKWVDGVKDERCVEDFYLNGDTAPFGRFNYLYACR